MNYLQLINNFWKLAAMQNFSNFEMALYFYLLDKCNKSRWQLPIIINSGSIIDFFGVHRNTLSAAFKNLNTFTNVKIVKNRGSKFLKVAIENVQLCENNVQLSNNKPTIENVQLLDDTEKVAQQPAIENVQLLENLEILHYNNSNIYKNKKYIYKSKKTDFDSKKLSLQNLRNDLQKSLNNI